MDQCCSSKPALLLWFAVTQQILRKRFCPARPQADEAEPWTLSSLCSASRRHHGDGNVYVSIILSSEPELPRWTLSSSVSGFNVVARHCWCSVAPQVALAHINQRRLFLALTLKRISAGGTERYPNHQCQINSECWYTTRLPYAQAGTRSTLINPAPRPVTLRSQPSWTVI